MANEPTTSDFTSLTRALSELKTAILRSSSSLGGGGSDDSAPRNSGGLGGGGGGRGSRGGGTSSRYSKKIQDLLKDLENIVEKQKKNTKMAGMAGETARQAEIARAKAEEVALRRRIVSEIRAERASNRAREKQRKINEAYDEAVKHNTKLTAESSGHFVDSLNALNRAFGSLDNSIRTNWNAFESLNFNINKSVMSQSSLTNGLLEASGLENDAYDAFSKEILKVSSSLTTLNKNNLGAADNIDTLTKNLQRATEDYSLMEESFDAADGSMKEFIESLILLRDSGNQLSDAQTRLLQRSKDAGLIDNANNVASNEAFNDHIKAVKNDIFVIQKTAAGQIRLHKTIEEVTNKLGAFGSAIKSGSGLAMVGAGLEMIGSGAKGIYDQMVTAADAGFLYSDGMKELKTTQIDLGISFEQTAKMFQENRRILGPASGSLADFTETIRFGQEALMDYGVKNEEAAFAAIEMRKNMVSLGIDTTKVERVNASMKEQSLMYAKLKVTTGASIEQFKTLNEELFNSAEVQTTMYKLDNARRGEEMINMMKQRQIFTEMKMSAEGANKALLDIKRQGQQKMTTRLEQAAKEATAYAAFGGKDSNRFYQIKAKGLDKLEAGSEDAKFYNKAIELMARETSSAKTEAGNRNTVIEGMADVFAETTEALLNSDYSKGILEAKMNRDATGGAISPDQTDKKVEQATNATLAATQHLAAVAETLSKDPVAELLKGMFFTGFGVALMASQGLLNLQVGAIAKSIGGSALGSAKNAFNAIAKTKGGRGSIVGMGVGMVAAGAGMYYDHKANEARAAGDEKGAKEADKTSKKLETFGNVMGIASTIAAAASLTGIGAAAAPFILAGGAVAGATLGYFAGEDDEETATVDNSSDTTKSATVEAATAAAEAAVLAAKPGAGMQSTINATPGITKTGAYAPVASTVGSTAGTSTGSSAVQETNAPVVSLSKETIAQLAEYLISLNTVQTSMLGVNKEQLLIMNENLKLNKEDKDALNVNNDGVFSNWGFNQHLASA